MAQRRGHRVSKLPGDFREKGALRFWEILTVTFCFVFLAWSRSPPDGRKIVTVTLAVFSIKIKSFFYHLLRLCILVHISRSFSTCSACWWIILVSTHLMISLCILKVQKGGTSLKENYEQGCTEPEGHYTLILLRVRKAPKLSISQE